jgi:UDP:flavonoid glycosyltransferase YjiC (YdhE family)
MRILFSATPTPGHVFPLLPLAQAARDDGHDVALLTSAGIAPLIPHDIPVLGAGPMLDALFAEATRRVGGDPTTDPRPAVVAELFAATRVDLTIEEAMAAADRWRPDLVVSEWCDFVGPIVARALVVPATRLAYGPAYERDYEEAMVDAVAVRYEQLGLTPVDPVAVLDTCPPSLQSTGWRPSADRIPLRPQPHNDSASAWKRPNFDRVSDRPAVLVTLGTRFNDTALLNRIIAGLEQLDVNVLATVGPAGDPSRVTTASSGVHVERFVPLQQALSWVDLVVSHAGAGTVLATLSRGLPAVLIPQGADHFLNAECVMAAGAGITLLPGETSPVEIATAAANALDSRYIKAGASSVCDEIVAMPPAGYVIKLLTQGLAEAA